MKVSTKIAAYAWRFGMSREEYFKYQAAECDPYAMSEEELARRHDEERETLSQYCVARAKQQEEENRKQRTKEAIAKAKQLAAEEKARMTDETRKRIAWAKDAGRPQSASSGRRRRQRRIGSVERRLNSKRVSSNGASRPCRLVATRSCGLCRMVGKGFTYAADDPELTPIATSLAAEGIERALFAVDTLALSAKLALFRCLP